MRIPLIRRFDDSQLKQRLVNIYEEHVPMKGISDSPTITFELADLLYRWECRRCHLAFRVRDSQGSIYLVLVVAHCFDL